MDGQTSIVDFLPEGEKKFILAEDLEKAYQLGKRLAEKSIELN